jgi:hypothetical protein
MAKKRWKSVTSDDPSVRNSELATVLLGRWNVDEIVTIEWLVKPDKMGWEATLAEEGGDEE